MDQNMEVAASAENDQRAIADLLLFMVKALADYPDDVKVQFVSDEDGSAFEVRANDADLGLLIGKKGQTARALESIVNSNRKRTGRHFHLDIVGTGEEKRD
ncbi:MAG TPA: KH domain-containing protein [Acidobacteriaceae bacterium]|nr:KH domain-containing protein [Acidobacteriaceae bacterium]